MYMNQETVIASIITSLIASVVFWIIFSFIPNTIRYIKMRPRVERDIDDIKMQLFFYIQIPFLQSLHSASLFQSDINDGKLTKSDFEKALFGKCLSRDRCVNEFEHRLLPVGEKLKERVAELDVRLDRIQRYSSFMRMKEILLLKEVGENIHIYEYDEHKDMVDGVEFVAVNPTISYMASNFYDLYLLYHELVDICDSFILINRNMHEKYECTKRKLEKKKFVGYLIGWALVEKKYKKLLELQYAWEKSSKGKVEKKVNDFLELDSLKLVYLRGYLGFLDNKEEFYRFFT